MSSSPPTASSSLSSLLGPGSDPAVAARDLEAAFGRPETERQAFDAILGALGMASGATRAAADGLGPDGRKAEGLALLAWLLADRHGLDVASAVADRAMALGPGRPAVDVRLQVLERAGRVDDAEELLRRFLSKPAPPSSFDPLAAERAAALEAWKNGDVATSAALSRAILERSPSDGQARFRVAFGHYVAGEWAKASEALGRHARIAGDGSETVLPLAASLYHLGRYDESNDLLGKIVDRDADPTQVFLAWVQIAWNELGKGLFERAEGALERARAALAKTSRDAPEIRGAVHDIDAIEGAVDACCGQLDFAHRALVRLRRSGSPAAPIVEEAIADVEGGRARFPRLELPRHRRTRPRGPLADKLGAARPGDVVELEDGTWQAENLALPASITLRGKGPDTILSGRAPVLRAGTSGARLEKLTVMLEPESGGEALLVESGDLAVVDCILEARAGSAATVGGEARPSFERVRFRGGLGLCVRDDSAPAVRGGVVSSGSNEFGVLFCDRAKGELVGVEIAETDKACVRVEGSAAPIVSGCKTSGSKKGSGFWIGGEAAGTYEGNEVWGNACPGFAVDDHARPAIRKNDVHGHACPGIQLANHSEALVEDNDLGDCGERLLEVLHEAKGTIRGNRLKSARASAVWIGHGSSPTIEGNEIASTVGPLLDVGGSAKPTVRANRLHGGQGVAIRILGSAAGTWEANEVHGGGTAMQISETAAPVVRGLRVEGVSEAGLVVLGSSSPVIESGSITKAGSGIRLEGRATPRITGVTVRDVEGSAVESSAASGAVLTRCDLGQATGPRPTVVVRDGATLELGECSVWGKSSVAAVQVAGHARLTVVAGTIDGAGRAPVFASGEARVRLDGTRLSTTGGLAIDAAEHSGVALRGATTDGGEILRCAAGAEREQWDAEPPQATGAHASVVLLLRQPASPELVAAALGAEAGHESMIAFSLGSAALPRASFAAAHGPGGEGRDLVAAHAAWVGMNLVRPAEDRTKAMRDFAHAIRRVARATDALAVHCAAGTMLVPGALWTEAEIEARLGRLFCSVRRHSAGNAVVVETCGLGAFGQDDLQCEATADQADMLSEISWGLVDAIVNGGMRYQYRAVTLPVPGHAATFILQEGKHDFAPPRHVWLLQPIGDLSRGGGWAKKSEGKGFGKPAASWGKKT